MTKQAGTVPEVFAIFISRCSFTISNKLFKRARKEFGSCWPPSVLLILNVVEALSKCSTESVGAGQQISAKITKLDLTSLGAPLNTELSLAYVDAAGTSTKLGAFPVADGGASIEFTAPSALDGGYFELKAAASGTTFRLPSAIESGGSTGGDHVVINEAYLSGGSAGAAYQNKFIELYNPTDAEVSLDGWSLQYRSATGTANPTGVAALSGSIEAGGYFLVRQTPTVPAARSCRSRTWRPACSRPGPPAPCCWPTRPAQWRIWAPARWSTAAMWWTCWATAPRTPSRPRRPSRRGTPRTCGR